MTPKLRLIMFIEDESKSLRALRRIQKAANTEKIINAQYQPLILYRESMAIGRLQKQFPGFRFHKILKAEPQAAVLYRYLFQQNDAHQVYSILISSDMLIHRNDLIHLTNSLEKGHFLVSLYHRKKNTLNYRTIHNDLQSYACGPPFMKLSGLLAVNNRALDLKMSTSAKNRIIKFIRKKFIDQQPIFYLGTVLAYYSHITTFYPGECRSYIQKPEVRFFNSITTIFRLLTLFEKNRRLPAALTFRGFNLLATKIIFVFAVIFAFFTIKTAFWLLLLSLLLNTGFIFYDLPDAAARLRLYPLSLKNSLRFVISLPLRFIAAISG